MYRSNFHLLHAQSYFLQTTLENLLIFTWKQSLSFHSSPVKTIWMKCQACFQEKSKKITYRIWYLLHLKEIQGGLQAFSMTSSDNNFLWESWNGVEIYANEVLAQSLWLCNSSSPWLLGNPKRDTQANSADPDQMPHNAASDQGLHCLLSAIFV